MSLRDFFITPLIFIVLAIFLSNGIKRQQNSTDRFFYVFGFLIKCCVALLYGLLYQFYYEGGDTLNYYYEAQRIWKLFTDAPLEAIAVVGTSAGDYEADTYAYTSKIYFFKNTYDWSVVRIAAVAGWFCFCTYSSIALFFAAFCFWSSWKLYKTLSMRYPKNRHYVGFIIFFFPSIVVWTSGLSKDTLAWSCFCLIVHYTLHQKKHLLRNIIALVFWSVVLFYIRPYLLFALIPCLLLYEFVRRLQTQKNLIVKLFFLPLGLILTAVLGYLFFDYVILSERDFASSETIVRKVLGFHYDHLFRTGGAVYQLDIQEYSLYGFLQVFPEALEVTFLRPYLFEVQNIFMFITSLENILILFIAMRLLWQVGIFRFLNHTLTNKECLLFFSFAIVLGFVVGLTSYNFGALVRFKVPALASLLLGLQAARANYQITENK